MSAGAPVAPFLKEYRERAWEAFTHMALPTIQEDAWRRTDLRGLETGSFQLPSSKDGKKGQHPPQELLKPLVGEHHGGQLVLLPGGQVKIDLDPALEKKGVVFTDLAAAEREHPELLERILGKVVRPEEGKFSALAAALAQNGVLVYVPRGVQVDEPLHSILWGPGIHQAYFSHLLVYLEEGASLTYVHEAASPTEAAGQSLQVGS